MAKKVFTPFDGTVDAVDLNGWESVRVDVLGEKNTPAEARTFLGAAAVSHAHTSASPSINSIGGTAGFISPQDLEKFTKATAFPNTVQTQVPSGAVFLIMRPNGTVNGISLDALIQIFGSSGTNPTPGGVRDGGEFGGTVNSIRDGGEFGGVIKSIRDGGEAGGAINL